MLLFFSEFKNKPLDIIKPSKRRSWWYFWKLKSEFSLNFRIGKNIGLDKSSRQCLFSLKVFGTEIKIPCSKSDDSTYISCLFFTSPLVLTIWKIDYISFLTWFHLETTCLLFVGPCDFCLLIHDDRTHCSVICNEELHSKLLNGK